MGWNRQEEQCIALEDFARLVGFESFEAYSHARETLRQETVQEGLTREERIERHRERVSQQG